MSVLFLSHFPVYSCLSFRSSSRNAIDSTRIWKWLTVPLRASKLNWTTFKLATGGDLADDRRSKTLSSSSGIPISFASLSFVSTGTYTLRLPFANEGHEGCDDGRADVRKCNHPDQASPGSCATPHTQGGSPGMQDSTEHDDCATPLPKKRREWRDSFANTSSSKKRRLSHSSPERPHNTLAISSTTQTGQGTTSRARPSVSPLPSGTTC